MIDVTYDRLFAYLAHLGFEDASLSAYERVFKHPQERILLAFSMQDDGRVERPVRSSDMMSVEFRLQQHGLLVGDLQSAARSVTASK